METFETTESLPVMGYRYFAFIASCFQSVFLLLLRLTWGFQFFQTGKGKLLHLDRTAGYFASLHIPMPKLNAAMAGSTECFGGLLLMLGLGSRLASIPLTITMIVAYLTAERPDIHSLDDFVRAGPFPFLMTSLIVLIFGPGKASLDYLLERTVFARPSPRDPDLQVR